MNRFQSLFVKRVLWMMGAALLLALTACEGTAPRPTETAVSQRPTTDTAAVTPAPAFPTPTATAVPTLTASPTSLPHTSTAAPFMATVPAAQTPTATAVPTLTATPAPVIDVAGAIVPPGFSFIKFADFYRPTSLAFDGNGRLLATSFDGSVHLLTDSDGNGHADEDVVFAAGFNTPLGVVSRPGSSSVYVSSMGKITLLRDDDGDGSADTRADLIMGLPTGLHQNDNLKFGPDGLLYMGLGSTCDACTEANPRSASILKINPDSGFVEVVATGLRNPYDLAFQPGTGALFATDNGRDDLGFDAPAEELNHIIAGGEYGWPGCWDVMQGDDCAGTETAVAFFEPRSSANSLTFYTGNRFPPAYRSDLYVAVFGSFAKPGVQTGVARVQLTPQGSTYIGEVSWFAQWPDGMPLGLTVGPEGALYVGDYINNAIYRISYGP